MHVSVDDPWSGLRPPDVARLLRSVRDWWVAGGWAIELWLGEETRAHDDFDIGCRRGDADAVLAALEGWDAWHAEDGRLTPLPDRRVPATGTVWLRRSGAEAWDLQLMPESSVRDRWRFRRDWSVTRAFDSVTWRTTEGIEVLRPEIQLLYKAKDVRPKDRQDFDRVVPTLDDASRAWLRRQLEHVHPGHAWLTELGEAP